MAINKYFNQTRRKSEQDLYTSLVIETIQIHGVDVLYIKRENLEIDPILNETKSSTFKDTLEIEMYIPESEQPQGDLYFMSQIGISYKETSEAYVSIRRWREVAGDELIQPREGDLIYVGNPYDTYESFINKMYEIKSVSVGHPERGQFGKNHTYRILMEIYSSGYDEFDTDINDIDNNYNTDLQEELANAINTSSDKEACKVMEQTENPFGEDYKTNSINNPFGDIM